MVLLIPVGKLTNRKVCLRRIFLLSKAQLCGLKFNLKNALVFFFFIISITPLTRYKYIFHIVVTLEPLHMESIALGYCGWAFRTYKQHLE